jgi:hypothetical protein
MRIADATSSNTSAGSVGPAASISSAIRESISGSPTR